MKQKVWGPEERLRNLSSPIRQAARVLARVFSPSDSPIGCRCNLAVLSFFLWLLSAPACEQKEKLNLLDLQIQKQGFGAVSVEDLGAVLNSAALEIKQYCPGTVRIDVYHRTDHPQTDFEKSADDRITIGLTASGTHWAQYSFQFAHEFCHTVANFSNNPGGRYPLHENFWLEESLCETASYSFCGR